MAISVLVAFNQHKYNETNQCILVYAYEFNQIKYHKINSTIVLYLYKKSPKFRACWHACWKCYCL